MNPFYLRIDTTIFRARFYVALLLGLLPLTMRAQAPGKLWDKSIGGESTDIFTNLITLPDGGYVLGGNLGSNFWVIRYDANHTKQWEKTFGANAESLNAIITTADGGFLLGGMSYSDPADGIKAAKHYGSQDYWVVKINATGDYQWDQSYGGTSSDELQSICSLSDGSGYLLGGKSYSEAATSEEEGNKEAEYLGMEDYWVVKIDLTGNRVWDKTYGGSNHDILYAIAPTTDGKYLLGGGSNSTVGTGKQAVNIGGSDFWLVKIDPSGAVVWDKTLGGASEDGLRSILPTADGGFVLSGHSDSGTSGTKTEGSQGASDYWVVRVDSECVPIWDKTLGGSSGDNPPSAVLTADGGVLVGGYSTSPKSGNKSEEGYGSAPDYWAVKLASDGTFQWDKTLGTTGEDELNAVAQLPNGNYLLAGFSYAIKNGDKTSEPIGSYDGWLVLLGDCLPPVLTFSTNATTSPILQNTPGMALSVTGCSSGTLTWSGPGGSTGTSASISVPTSATGTFVYSATCTQGSCSATASHTVTVSPPLVTGSFDGFVYGADCSTFRGWAWDRNKPNTVQSVDILDGPNFVTTVAASEFRQDLKDAGKGNGIHAFRWSIPESLKDGQVHYLSARVSGSSFILKDSPKALICQGGSTPPPTNKQPVAPTVTPLVAQQGVAFTTTLPVFTDPEGSTLSYGLVSLPTGLTFTSSTRVISGTALQSGQFTLAYSATDDKGATNSVSLPLTVNPAATTPVTGSFEGYLDKVECGTIRGWVWDRNKPNTPVTVEFYTGGDVWGSVVANIYRVDLKNAGKGNGVHAYSFEVPTILKDGNTRLIRARVSGSTYDLKDSGKPLTCLSPVRLSAESSEGLHVTVLGNPVPGNFIEVEIQGAAGQTVRLDLRDMGGRPLREHVIENAKTVERLSIPVHQRAAGLYWLHVASGSGRAVLKVLKP